MKTSKLQAALQQIQAILNDLLPRANVRSHRERAPRRQPSSTRSGSAHQLPNHILRLRDSGFFRPAKTALETHAKLESAYPCALNRVAVTLLRLQQRKLLRQTSKVIGKRKQVAYGW